MSKLVPLSELPSIADYDAYHPDAPPVTWDVELPPHVDQDRLLFNAGHMNRLQKLGYFSVNHFTSFQGDATQYEPTIVGMESDGTALAGNKASLVKRAEETQNSVESPAESLLARKYFKAEAKHNLNRSEMSRLVTEKLQRQTRTDESTDKAWATVLNHSSQDAVTKTARQNLIGKDMLGIKLTDAGIYATLIAQDIGLSHSPESLLFNLGESVLIRAGIFATFDSVINKAMYGSTFIKERRWTSFSIMQPEAYVALSALASVSPLIKYRK